MGIFIINLLQAILTPVIGDEAYYWTYSQHLAWGYFDHPPMVALLIKGSEFLFNHALSIRFLTVIFSLFTASIMWQLIPIQDKKTPNSTVLFWLLLLAIPGFHLYGFITTPDVPLLFFFALYWWAFEKLHVQNNWKHALMVGIAAAFLLYSKYHGGIFILLSVLFRWRLLKHWTIYLAGFIALLLLLPHLYWQYQHDFITFNYHLFQRTDGHFNVQNIWNFIGGSIVVLNPVLLLLVVLLVIKKQLSWTYPVKMLVGILGFFLLYAFRSKVEAHWVIAAFIPLVMVLHDIGIREIKIFKTLKNISIVSIVLLLFVRVLLFIPLPIQSEFHVQKGDYFEAIEQAAAGKKVVFVNSYQKASKYQFYTGQSAFSYNNDWYRKNQYDLEANQTNFHNQTIYMVGDYPSPFFDSIYSPKGELFLGASISNFPVLTQLNANIVADLSSLKPNAPTVVEIQIDNPYSYAIDFEQTSMPKKLFLLFLSKNERYYIELKNKPSLIPAFGSAQFDTSIELNSIPIGQYEVWLVIQSGNLYFQKISEKYTIEIAHE